MRDWTGTRARTDAEQVPCRYCGANPGQTCVQNTTRRPLQAFPAHTNRTTDAQKTRTPQERP